MAEGGKFGQVRRADFSFAPGYVNINHGSFGATPKVVAEAQRGHTAAMEGKPDAWFRRDYRKDVHAVREQLARYAHAQTDDLVLVENASSGFHAVLRALQYTLGSGDVVAVLSSAYPMVRNTLDYLAKMKGFSVEVVDVQFPVAGEADFVAAAEKLLESVPVDKLKIFMVSHITSIPAVVVPLTAMATVLKARVPSLHIVVDGAHALGQIPVNLTQLEAAGIEYYVATGYKWLYSPKGTAFLWVSKKSQEGIVPTIVSAEGFPSASFIDCFTYTGTRDYTPYCTMGAAFDYRAALGDSAIMGYMHRLATQGGQLLTSMWKTEVIAPERMYAAMVDVRLPTVDSDKVSEISTVFETEHNMFIVVYQLTGSDPPTFWTRLCAQIYLELSDFEKVGRLVLEIIDRPVDKANVLEPVIIKP